MSWEKYFEAKTERHELDDFGLDEFYVDLLSLDTFEYGDVKGYLEAVDVSSPEEVTAEDMEENDETLARCIVDWNISHPRTGEDLPVPDLDDCSSLDALPQELIAQFHLWLQEDSDIQSMVPTRSAPSSTPTS